MSSLSDLRTKIVSLLPIMLIGLIGMGLVMFAVTQVMPSWRIYENLSNEVERARSAVEAQLGATDPDENLTILRSQITSVEEQLNESAALFLSEDEADNIMDSLYVYASVNEVRITNLKAEEPDRTAATEAPIYDVRVYQLQVEGKNKALMNFVTYIREATIPGVHVANVSVTEGVLFMDMLMYTSSLAPGTVLIAAQPVVLPGSASQDDSGQIVIPPSVGADTSTVVALYPQDASLTTIGPTDVEMLGVGVECPGAPPTLFKVGDTAVVDFSEIGALRLLARVDSGIFQTRAQAYDGQQLLILDGPACGKAGAANVLFWYVERQGFGNYRGWAAEAVTDDRWMCPMDDPECSQ